MDYLSLIKMQDENKIALIVDDEIFTYRKLAKRASAIREQILKDDGKNKRAIFIYEDSISVQLIEFLAYSGTPIVPIIATKVSKQQDFSAMIENIPKRACMGVMTSGSTGKSKLLWRNYHSWADFFPEQNRIFNLNSSSVIFCQGSLAFTGNLNIYLGVLSIGATVVASDNFRPKMWLNLIDKYKVNSMYLIPTKLLLLLKFTKKENSQIKTIVSGSQSLGKREADKIKQIYTRAIITLYYGASELNYITYIKDDKMTEDRLIVGKPFKNVELSLKNEEIFVKTPYAIEGIEMPFSLKDKGCIDEEANLHFLGRTDDIYNVNGIKISSYKVENVLKKVLDTEDIAIKLFRQDNSDFIVAFIASSKRKAKTELINTLKVYLTEFEIPKKFIYITSLPKNESGKIDKIKLLSIYQKTLTQ